VHNSGKSVSLQVIAEHFSKIGVPVFISDVKGDLRGIGYKGNITNKIAQRLSQLEITDFKFEDNLVQHWDVFGKTGSPMRTTFSRISPLLLTRVLDLTNAQEGSLYQLFRIATDYKINVNDITDLNSIINTLIDNAESFEEQYGKISKQSFSAIQRSILILQESGSSALFSKEGAFDVSKLLSIENGKGIINILDATKLIHTPRVYAIFLLWLLGELYTTLPEVGDLNKPKLVFFFDEAHLLFDDAPKILVNKIEQLVKLIRSKGVGIFFVTQNPGDIPDDILGQLGNRIIHSMRAFTPKEQKAIRTIAQTFRSNSSLDVESEIMKLGVGEALISVLDHNGVPTIVEKGLIVPPHSQIGIQNVIVAETGYINKDINSFWDINNVGGA